MGIRAKNLDPVETDTPEDSENYVALIYGIATVLEDDPLDHLDCEIRFVGEGYDFGLDPKFDPYSGNFWNVSESMKEEKTAGIVQEIQNLPQDQQTFIAKWGLNCIFVVLLGSVI